MQLLNILYILQIPILFQLPVHLSAGILLLQFDWRLTMELYNILILR